MLGLILMRRISTFRRYYDWEGNVKKCSNELLKYIYIYICKTLVLKKNVVHFQNIWKILRGISRVKRVVEKCLSFGIAQHFSSAPRIKTYVGHCSTHIVRSQTATIVRCFEISHLDPRWTMDCVYPVSVHCIRVLSLSAAIRYCYTELETVSNGERVEMALWNLTEQI